MKSTGKTFPWMSTAFWGLTLPILIVITISIENFPAMAADNSKPSGKVVRDFESGIHLDPFENMAMDRANYKAASFTGGATVLLFIVILVLVYNIIQRKRVEKSLRVTDENVRVLLSSGYSINGDASAILAKGCNGFIQKPFNLEGLSKSIREVIG